jgi:hypothetical protein
MGNTLPRALAQWFGPGQSEPHPPDVFDVGSIAEEFVPPDDDRSHINDWLMVRDIRRRLVEGT